jgi:hypothetical protein
VDGLPKHTLHEAHDSAIIYNMIAAAKENELNPFVHLEYCLQLAPH